MSHTVRNKVKGVKFNAQAVAEALKRMELVEGEDFHVSNKADHFIVDYTGTVKEWEPPVQVWIESKCVPKVRGAKRGGASNEVGFRADENGNLEIVNSDHDSRVTFTPTIIKQFTDFTKIEALKMVARKKGHTKFVEQVVKGKLKLFVQ